MAYHVIDPEDLERTPGRPSDMRYISEAAGMKNMGLRVYYVNPGERIPLSGMHYHDTQEEVFYVEAGELHVETPDEEFVIPAGQFFIAEPEDPHRAYVPETVSEVTKLIGIGAPVADDGHHLEGYPDELE